MPAQRNLRHVALFSVLGTCLALGRFHFKLDHDATLNDMGAASLYHDIYGLADDGNSSAPATPVKLPTKGKVGHINVTQAKQLPTLHAKAKVAAASDNSANQSQATENKTKVIEEAVVSLPMASFALEIPKPIVNKTEQPFPGNATVKAAWEMKEKHLEDEVASLKARLTNVSEVLDTPKLHPPSQAAAGTFHASIEAKSSKNFRVAKGSEQDKKPKADLPTMAPVTLKHMPVAASVPPQKAAIQAQDGSAKKLLMDARAEARARARAAFTGTPVQKAESILALDAKVERDAVRDDDASAPQFSLWQGFSSFASWLTGSPSAAVVVEKPAAPTVAARKVRSLLYVKQDSERTARAVQEENHHSIELTDTWGNLEKEDGVEEADIRAEDRAERERAETAELPHMPSKSELQGRHGAQMSGFWRKLEKEDYNIQETVQLDDLVKYAELTQAQDTQVSKAADELDMGKLHPPTVLHKADSRLAIHEPWLHREQKDTALEEEIHDSPDLQMLQLKRRHRRQ